MATDYTHVSIILDRSGSMEGIRSDVIGGFNALLEAQKGQEGKATLTLVQFDSQDPYEVVHHFKPIEKVPELDRATYVPRSSTPLLDALGRGINDLEKTIGGMKESDRPLQVVFVVITDGQENSSREFRVEQIVRMIKEHKTRDGWVFTFLSADFQAIEDAVSYGFERRDTVSYDYSSEGAETAWTYVCETIDLERGKQSRKLELVKKEEDVPIDWDDVD